MDFAAFPVTFTLIIINVLFSLVGFSNAGLMEKAIMWPYGVNHYKQYWRFISSGFLHADFMHLFFNMFTLYFFGRNMEYIFYSSIP